MPIEQTLSIIKPDAVQHQKAINAKFEEAGLTVVMQKEMTLTTKQAEEFYQEHKGKPFFQELMSYITSGPVIVQILEGEDAVAVNRKVMGATNPKDAEPGTIRAQFAQSIDANAVHGSDSKVSAQREMALFFSESELASIDKLKHSSKDSPLQALSERAAKLGTTLFDAGASKVKEVKEDEKGHDGRPRHQQRSHGYNPKESPWNKH